MVRSRCLMKKEGAPSSEGVAEIKVRPKVVVVVVDESLGEGGGKK